jgi:tRNA-dihydrouridine synthase
MTATFPPEAGPQPSVFDRVVIRGELFEPALFCAPLAEITHCSFRRLVAELGGCGGQFTEMLSGRRILTENLVTSPSLRRSPGEKKLIYQLMLRPTDPVGRIVGRLSEIAPDGIDLNLACYAPVIRRLQAGSRLFEDLPALEKVLRLVRAHWDGLLTVKIRLGSSTLGSEGRFVERLRVIEDCGVDALTLHSRFFEDKFKRKANHDLFAWAGSLTPLPVIANGDIVGPETARKNPTAFAGVSGLMIGRMAVARPWLFAGWKSPVRPDYHDVWKRMADGITEDFPERVAIKRLRLFTTYYARNFHFGHTLYVATRNAPSVEIARERADAFFSTNPRVFEEPSLQGI